MTRSPRAPSTSFTVTIPTALVALLDKAIVEGGFRDRSDFVATCIRDTLLGKEAA